MHIGMCSKCICVRLDNALSRQGLQAAFANKTCKSHRRVGLPADVIASLTQDA